MKFWQEKACFRKLESNHSKCNLPLVDQKTMPLGLPATN